MSSYVNNCLDIYGLLVNPFDPNSLQGWHLDANQQYQLLTPNEQGQLWCQRLQLWLGTWEGEIEGKPAIWLRLFDSEGNLILLPEEAAEQARQQEVQARQQAEQAQRDAIPRLLAMGLTIEQVAEALGLSVDEINRNVR
ncbi:MAG: hypothetical protein RIE73_15485 [Coleofasciculus sp. C1-SOL-03]|uniref:hypothetical protein n=1 Tax=Coleofasciculus sp. C1-SOL-03 TaxID=3069522 RepID=UPI0032F6A079